MGDAVISVSGGNLLLDDVELATQDWVDNELDDIDDPPLKGFNVGFDTVSTNNGFTIDSEYRPDLNLNRNSTYRFNTHSSQIGGTTGHHFRIEDRYGLEYTDGVAETGTQGQSGAYILWSIPNDAPGLLYYDCGDGGHTVNEGGRIAISALTEDLIPKDDNTVDIGSSTKKVRDLYLSESSLHMGDTVISISGGNMLIDNTEVATQDYVDNELDDIDDNIWPVKEFVVTYSGIAGSGGDFLIDGTTGQDLRIGRNLTYRFALSSPTLASHDFRIQDHLGTEYTTGVVQVGTQGMPNAYLLWAVDESTPGRMSYGCGEGGGNHDTEGGRLTIDAITEHLVPLEDNTFDIGSPTKKVKDIYMSESSLHLGDSVISVSGGNLLIDDTEIATEEYVDNEMDEIDDNIWPVKEFVVSYAGVAGSGGDFLIDGANQDLRIGRNLTYRFDLSSATLASHDFRIEETGGTEYTTGIVQVGTQGMPNAYLLWAVDESTPGRMSYGCGEGGGNHDTEGGRLTIDAITEHLVPLEDNTFDIGSPTKKVKDIYMSESSLHMGDTHITISGGNLLVGETEVATQDYVEDQINEMDTVVREFAVTLETEPVTAIHIDGESKPVLELTAGLTYRFNLESNTLNPTGNSPYNFYLSSQQDGIAYTQGVAQFGTEGNVGSYML